MNRPVTSKTTKKTCGLSDLALTLEDYRDLRRQGGVHSEQRRGTIYYKLRFRTSDGRQRVRYLGTDPAVAESIRHELQQLQALRRRRLDLAKRDKEARELLRQVKENLTEVLVTQGFSWHGFVIRKRNGRRRSDKPGVHNTDQQFARRIHQS